VVLDIITITFLNDVYIKNIHVVLGTMNTVTTMAVASGFHTPVHLVITTIGIPKSAIARTIQEIAIPIVTGTAYSIAVNHNGEAVMLAIVGIITPTDVNDAGIAVDQANIMTITMVDVLDELKIANRELGTIIEMDDVNLIIPLAAVLQDNTGVTRQNLV
jgi:hypothetical protein